MTEVLPECRRLAAELCLLRDRAGLSLAALGTRTHYSKSSWHRWTGGLALPPWAAVRALCDLAGEPEPRLRALWELAESAWSGRGTQQTQTTEEATGVSDSESDREPDPEPESESVPEPVAAPLVAVPRKRRIGGVVVVVGLLLGCASITAGAADLGDRGKSASSAASSGTAAAVFHVACTGASCDGRDPQVTLCGVEPQTLIHQQTSTGVGLEIRYQPLCHAAWARVWNTQIGDSLTITAQGAPAQTVRVTDHSAVEAFVYTPMVSVQGTSAPIRACLTPATGTPEQCFSAPSP